MDGRRRVALVALALSFAALAAAPLVLPADFSPVAHTTSESAGQGVSGAWLPRLGFALFGVGVLVRIPVRCSWLGGVLHATFGTAMFVVAAFASRSWRDAPYDATEDLVHSIGATAMGFAFAGGVAAAAITEARRTRRPPRTLDVVAVAASVVLPLGMVALPDVAGLLQRVMFTVAYLWYGRELLRGRGQG